jgi:hypothetical protein
MGLSSEEPAILTGGLDWKRRKRGAAENSGICRVVYVLLLVLQAVVRRFFSFVFDRWSDFR